MNRKITELSMFLSIAIVIAMLESFLPVFVPGIKLGLANVVLLVTLFLYGPKDAFIILILRIVIVALLRTGFGQNFYIALSGGICSYLVMILVMKVKLFSVVGISILGAYFHILGQFSFLIFFYNIPQLVYYLGIVLLISFVSGSIVGIVCELILKRLISFRGKYESL